MHVPIVILLGHETYAKTVSIVWFGIHNGHRSGGVPALAPCAINPFDPALAEKRQKKKRAKKKRKAHWDLPSRGLKPPFMISSRSQSWRSVRVIAGSFSASATSWSWRGASRARRSLRTPPWGGLAIAAVVERRLFQRWTLKCSTGRWNDLVPATSTGCRERKGEIGAGGSGRDANAARHRLDGRGEKRKKRIKRKKKRRREEEEVEKIS